MNNNPTTPQDPRTVPTPSRPAFSVPAREGVGMGVAASSPAASPAAAPAPMPPVLQAPPIEPPAAAPATPSFTIAPQFAHQRQQQSEVLQPTTVTVPVLVAEPVVAPQPVATTPPEPKPEPQFQPQTPQPPSVTLPEQQAAPVDWQRERTLQPIDEAAVIRERTLAEDAVGHPAATAESGEAQPQQNLDVQTADDIERAPDNTPVAAEATTIEDFLPPVLDKNGKVDNTVVDDESIPWWKLLIAGMLLPLLWIALEYGVSWGLTTFLSAQMQQGSLSIEGLRNGWSSLLRVIPFVELGIVALLISIVLKYPHKGYRALLSLGIAVCTVGLMQLLPRISELAEYVTSSTGIALVLTNLQTPFIVEAIGLQKVLITLGIFVLMGIASAFVLYGILKLMRYKTPGFVVVIAMILVAATPIGVTIPIVAAERQEAARQLEEIRRMIET